MPEPSPLLKVRKVPDQLPGVLVEIPVCGATDRREQIRVLDVAPLEGLCAVLETCLPPRYCRCGRVTCRLDQDGRCVRGAQVVVKDPSQRLVSTNSAVELLRQFGGIGTK